MSHKKRLIKTNRVHLVFALNTIIEELPESGTIEEWCIAAEAGFKAIGYDSYCHKSAQINLFKHAKKYGEYKRAQKALYHCDMQHDIAMLNRDTNDPSGANTDPLFPREEYWVFRNFDGNADLKVVDRHQLAQCYRKYDHIQLDSQYMLSSDGHKCLSSPELFIEEFFIANNIAHIKEGDTDKVSGKRLTEYPFDEKLNANKRSKEADWKLEENDEPVFVEYFEGRMDKKYFEKVEVKRELSRKHCIKLIEIWRQDLSPEVLKTIFANYI